MPLETPLRFLRDGTGLKGSALVWFLEEEEPGTTLEIASRRPAGVVLILILPPASSLTRGMDLMGIISQSKPSAIVPYHEDVEPEDIAALVRRPPPHLAVELTDYLAWRGIRVDRETRRVIRRTVTLSEQVSTVASLSRATYLSRRALGRRFVSRGLPVPSHWLQFSRILRAVVRLQNCSDSLHTVACGLGYPDGFALSNQMKRLTGIRPSIARACLGWEWLVECWLQMERSKGALKCALPEVDLENISPEEGGKLRTPSWMNRKAPILRRS